MKFSSYEIKEIVKAWLAVSVIFAIALVGVGKFLIALPITLVTAGIGFLFHELAHKYVAQKYKCWAEFRANNSALLIGVLLSFLGFVLVAPGGVFIQGATRQQNGRIAFAGPLMNVMLAVIFFGLSFIAVSPLLGEIISYGFRINALLAAFNLIPLRPFDGYTVLEWNKMVYFASAVVSVILVVVSVV